MKVTYIGGGLHGEQLDMVDNSVSAHLSFKPSTAYRGDGLTHHDYKRKTLTVQRPGRERQEMDILLWDGLSEAGAKATIEELLGVKVLD